MLDSKPGDRKPGAPSDPRDPAAERAEADVLAETAAPVSTADPLAGPEAGARTPHMPADHPAVKPARVGVLLANLGTPDGTDYRSMRRYLSEFLSDRRVIDYSPWIWQPLLQGVILSKRPFASGAAYRSIWNHEADESPLMTITKAQTAKLRTALQARYGEDVLVDFCMRYGNPSTASRLEALREAGARRILFFPLYPQYAGATSATACDALFRALTRDRWQPPVRTVPAYFEDAAYVGALAASVERAYAALDPAPEVLVCSYHGLPRRYLLEGDPYHCQCQKTTRLLRERLGLGRASRRHHLPVALRARGVAQALHRRGGRAPRRGGRPPARRGGARLLGRLHRDARGDPGGDPRGLRGGRGRAVHLHPLPQRRRRPHRGAGRRGGARAARLARLTRADRPQRPAARP